MDIHARPSDIISAHRYKHNRERELIIGLASTVAKMIAGVDNPIDAISHLYTGEELEVIRQQRAEAEEARAEAQQIAILQRLANAGKHRDKSSG